jgi:Flp pilus assembly protein TadG
MFQRTKNAGRTAAKRRGASAVEFALIAPVMILFTFGLIELGRITMVKQTATHASREGARVAVRPTATTEEVLEQVNEELTLWDLDGATVLIEPSDLAAAEPGTQVTVSVSLELASITWIPDYFTFGTNTLVAETSMRRESTN